MAAKIFKSAKGEEAVKQKYDEWLRHWPVEKEELSIDTHLGKTFVIASGNPANPALFLLHGSAGNSIQWLKDVAEYSKAYRVYAVDIPGQPGHSEAVRPKLKGAAASRWIEELMEALQEQRATFVGMSLGAWLSLKFACAHPERVERLAVISPAGIVKRRKRFRLKALLYRLLCGPFARRMIARSLRGKDSMEPRVEEMWRLITRYFKPRGQPPVLKARDLTQLYCPILLILGGRDKLFNPDRVLVKLARAVPQLEVIVRNDSGHLLSEFGREVDRFLSTDYLTE